MMDDEGEDEDDEEDDDEGEDEDDDEDDRSDRCTSVDAIQRSWGPSCQGRTSHQ